MAAADWPTILQRQPNGPLGHLTKEQVVTHMKMDSALGEGACSGGSVCTSVNTTRGTFTAAFSNKGILFQTQLLAPPAERAEMGSASLHSVFLSPGPAWSKLRAGMKRKGEGYGGEGRDRNIQAAPETKAGR